MCFISDGDHSQLPSEHITEEANGIRYLRAQDLRDGTIISEKPIYVTREYFNTIPRSHIKPNYLLFSVMASIGSVAVVPEWLEECTANRAVGILIPRNSIVNPHYLAAFFSTSVGTSLFESLKKGGIQQRINLSDLGGLPIPLPPIDIQNSIASILAEGYRNKHEKEADAQALLDSIDDYLLKQTGINSSMEAGKKVFIVNRSRIQGAFNPERYSLIHLENMIQGTTIGEATVISDELIMPSRMNPSDTWDWIRIDDLPNHPLKVGEIRTALGAEIQGTFFGVQEDDILLARLGPTIQNAKFVLCPKTVRQTVASSEFLVLRCSEGWIPNVVLWILRTKLFRKLIYSKSRGGTPSRYRVNRRDLAALPFPIIEIQKQKELSAEINVRLKEVQHLREQATQGLAAAKVRIERIILGEQA